MNKKIIGLAAIMITLIFSTSNVNALSLNEKKNYINYYGIEITQEQHENLLNLGFTEEQIETMDQAEFENNKNLKGEIVAQNVVYQKNTLIPKNRVFSTYASDDPDDYYIYSEEVTEEEYYNSPTEDSTISTHGLIDGQTLTEYKKLTSTIIAVNGRYRLKGDMQWRKMPKVRKKDLFTLVMDQWVSSAPGTFNAVQTAGYNNVCDKKTDYARTNPTQIRETRDGYAISFKLPTDQDQTCTQVITNNLGQQQVMHPYKPVYIINSYMYYEINKSYSGINTLNAYADYAHGTGSLSIDPTATLSLSNGGIGLELTITASHSEKFDSMRAAHAALTGINW